MEFFTSPSKVRSAMASNEMSAPSSPPAPRVSTPIPPDDLVNTTSPRVAIDFEPPVSDRRQMSIEIPMPAPPVGIKSEDGPNYEFCEPKPLLSGSRARFFLKWQVGVARNAEGLEGDAAVSLFSLVGPWGAVSGQNIARLCCFKKTTCPTSSLLYTIVL